MKKLHDDDYLIEITIRLAVDKEDAATLLALAGPPYSDDHSEQDRIMSAVLDFVDGPIMDHNRLDYRAASIRRIPTVKLFDDFESPENLAG
jgi:hypothetical protein